MARSLPPGTNGAVSDPTGTGVSRSWPGLAREALWCAAIVGGSLAPLAAILISGHTIAWFDSTRLYAPTRGLISEALRSGRLPLWNPYEGTGMPLFAQGLHGVLHPWSLLAALLAPGDGMDLMIVLHVATGALGAAVLGRVIGASRSGAAVAGLGYGLSGYLLSMARTLPFLAAAGTAPWAIAGIVASVRGGRWRLPLAAAGVATLHFAGDPQWTVVAVLLGALLSWNAAGWRGVVRASAAAAVGSLVAAIQLVPSWAYLGRTARRVGLPELERTQWSLAPWRLLEFMAPGFFAGAPGSLEAPVFQWLGGPGQYSLPFVFSVAIGGTVLFLDLWAVAEGRTGRVLAAAALVLLWLAMGHHLLASEVVAWVPIWNRFRYSEKLVGPLTLILAEMAALGADALGRRPEKSAVRVALACTIGTGIVAAAAFVAMDRAGPSGVPPLAWSRATGQLALGMAQATTGLGAMTALLLAGRRWSRAVKPRLAMALGLLVLLQGLAASRHALHRGRPGVRDVAPLHELTGVTAVPRLITPFQGLWLPSWLDEVDGAVWSQSRMGLPSFAVASRVDHLDTYTGLEPERVSSLFRLLKGLGPGQLVALRRFGVTHVVVPADTATGEETLRSWAITGGRRIATNREAHFEVWAVPHRPWASFAERVRPVATESEAMGAVVDLEAAGDPAVTLVGPVPRDLSPGIVLAVERSSDSLKVLAEATGSGLLIVNDADWPGWEATIDGQPAKIQLADGLVRAVQWPAGRHVLEMRYRPTEVRTGWLLSACGTLLMLGLATGWRPSPVAPRTS